MTDPSGEPTAAAKTHNCAQCGAGLDFADRYCRACGLEQRADAAAASLLVARILPGRIDAALKDRIREQKVVEVEIAELLAERAIKWLKSLAFFLGIPIAMMAAILSFLEIKAWSDLQRVASQTLELQKNLAEPKQRLAQATEQIAQLQTDLDAAKKKLTSEISEVGKRQGDIEDQLRTIRNRLGFCPGTTASASLKEKLQDTLSRFVMWLQGIGFNKLDDRIEVCFFSKEAPIPVELGVSSDQPNSFFWNNTLYIHKDMSEDTSIALREYSHYALLKSQNNADYPQTEIESAVADYLSASFLRSPIIGANLGPLFGSKTTYVRTLDNTFTYQAPPSDDWHGRGQVWAGALWVCWQRGRMQLDQLILTAWQAASTMPIDHKRFGAALAAAPTPVGPCLSDQIRRRGLPR